MNIDYELLICAIGLALIFEGLPWTLFPDFMRRTMTALINSPTNQIRRTGLITIAVGLIIVWLIRSN